MSVPTASPVAAPMVGPASQSLFNTTSRLSGLLYPEFWTAKGLEQHVWRTLSASAFQSLISCIELDSCAPNQKKVIIVGSMYFRHALRGEVGGEEIWAYSTIKAMRNTGYTVLYVHNLHEAVQVYRILPSLVKIVIVDDWDSFGCWKDEQNCLRTVQNPSGIPGYKILSFYFWPFPRHPLGPRWILAPEPYYLENDNRIFNNTYLGYSIEGSCAMTEFVPSAARPDPPRVWLQAKLLSYFVPGRGPGQDRAWSKEDLDFAAEQTGATYRMAASHKPLDIDKKLSPEKPGLPDAAINYGRLNQSLFMEKIANSRVLLGMGSPIISPTPWNSLCLGVPYINPVWDWDRANPDDSSKWHTQHPFAALLSKPYVYNVRSGDRKGLAKAIEEALANPIGSYIPERMRMASIEKRLAEIVDTDWEAEEKKQAEWCNELCGCAKPCDTWMLD